MIDHELGHNLGLYHSHSISCPPAVLGPTCTTLDYGDSIDTMGGSGGHYNAFQKQRLGWLGYGVSPPITSVQSSGTHTIAAYEAPGSVAKALKIQRGPASAQAFFFVELRTKTLLDSFLPSIGVFVHMASDNNSNSSYLLDMTPETQYAWYYEFLAVGKSFTDSVSGVTIETVSANSTSATIVVTMGGASVDPDRPRRGGTPIDLDARDAYGADRACGRARRWPDGDLRGDCDHDGSELLGSECGRRAVLSSAGHERGGHVGAVQRGVRVDAIW